MQIALHWHMFCISRAVIANNPPFMKFWRARFCFRWALKPRWESVMDGTLPPAPHMPGPGFNHISSDLSPETGYIKV